MKRLLIALFLLSSYAAAAPRPNIIVILADDMGFSDSREEELPVAGVLQFEERAGHAAPRQRVAHPRDVVAAIAPHAGWVYSGAVAFHALEALARARADARLVIVFGGHLGLYDRPRLMVEGAWQTPASLPPS